MLYLVDVVLEGLNLGVLGGIDGLLFGETNGIAVVRILRFYDGRHEDNVLASKGV